MNFSLNLPTWFPLAPKVQAGMADAPDETDASPRSAGLGPITGRDLSDLGSLVKPFVRDPFNRLRPPFSREAAELSLELASMAYTLDLEPWTEAGWNDFSIQIDDDLQSGLTRRSSADGERMRALINALKVRRAKAALRERNPVSQVMSALRQRELMACPDGKGGIVLLKAGAGTAGGSLRQGQNILSAEGQFDMADRFSDYLVKGQKPGTDKGWGKDACAVRGQYRDQAVQRYRPMLIRAEQSGDSSNAHQRAAWECSVRAARAVTVTATVQGFRQQGVGREQSGPLWQLNQMADVDLPYLRISQRLLVAGVEFRRDATSGSTTRLTLRDPAAFKPEPPKEEKGDSGSGGGDVKMEKEVDLQTRLAQDAAARQKAIK